MRRFDAPPIVRTLTSGRWPYAWLAILTLFGVVQWVVPPSVEAVETRAENAQERDLVRSYRSLAGEEPAERVRHETARAWWTDHGPGRARGTSMALAASNAQERLRGLIEGAGCTVTKLEAMPPEKVSDGPRSGTARLNVQFAADRMETLANVLTSIESPAQGAAAPWFRIGNTTVSRSAYSAITGVIVDATVYVWLEPAS